MNTYYSGVMDVIRDSLESIDLDIYDQIINESIEVLKSGGKIIASGLGKNVPICEKFVGTLNSLGLDARFLHTNSAVHGDLGMVGKNDIVYLLSKGGNTHETVALAEHLKARGTDTWLMTFTEKCKSAEVIDKRLIMHLINEGTSGILYQIIPQRFILSSYRGLHLRSESEWELPLKTLRLIIPVAELEQGSAERTYGK